MARSSKAVIGSPPTTGAIGGSTACPGTDRLALTIPFVLYGIFRYLYLVHQRRGGGSPTERLLTDRPLLACVGQLNILDSGFLILDSHDHRNQ